MPLAQAARTAGAIWTTVILSGSFRAPFMTTILVSSRSLKGTGGTVGDALAAVGRSRASVILRLRDTSTVVREPVSGHVPDVQVLDLVADLDAAHALDALALVPDQGKAHGPSWSAA